MLDKQNICNKQIRWIANDVGNELGKLYLYANDKEQLKRKWERISGKVDSIIALSNFISEIGCSHDWDFLVCNEADDEDDFVCKKCDKIMSTSCIDLLRVLARA